MNTEDVEQQLDDAGTLDENLEAEASKIESELQDLKDKHLRLAAEFDNYRKRVARDHQENVSRAQSGLLQKLVDVLDDLDRVAHHSDNSTKDALLDGVNLVEKKFRAILESAGLERIDATGGVFDPNTMEALTTMPTDKPEEDEHVGEVFQPGYRLGGTLLRPARVVVKKYQ